MWIHDAPPLSAACSGLAHGWEFLLEVYGIAQHMSLYTLNLGSVRAHFLIQITHLLSYSEVISFCVVNAAYLLCIFLIIFY